MAKLKRDERLCPVCAETIKAAAIKCRFCGTELTPVEPASVEPVEPEDPQDTEVEGLATPPAAATRPAIQRLTLILAGLVVLAATGVGYAWWRAEKSSADVAPNGALVSDEARTQALIAAADLTQRSLSYSYRSLKEDMEVARARMTPSFRREYDSTMKQVRANTIKNKIVLEADAVASSLVTATENRATALVFLNQTTTAQATDRQQMIRNTLVVTLARSDGDWRIHKLTALG